MSARTWIMRHHASLAPTLGWLRPTLFSEYVLSSSFMNIKMLEHVYYDEKENFDFFFETCNDTHVFDHCSPLLAQLLNRITDWVLLDFDGKMI